MESLKDQIAVVTGASSGIGKAIALSLAGQGAEVSLVARRRELLDDAAKQVHALGSRGHACPADLTKDEDIRGLGERFQKEFAHVNILVLCGGAIFHGPLENASLADFDLMYRSNVRGHYLMIQTMLPLLRKSDAGRIVNLSSILGSMTHHSTPGSPIYGYHVPAYNVSKAAVNAFTVQLAYELKDTKIKVNAAHPGWVKTDLGGEGAPMEIEDGAKTSVALATVGEDGPNGGYIHMGKPLPW